MKRLLFALAAACGTGTTTDFPSEAAFPSGPFWGGAPAGGAALVTNNYSDTVSTVALAMRAQTGELPVGLNPIEREGPHHDAIRPDGKRFFVGISNFVQGSGSGPHGQHGNGAAPGYALMYDATDLSFMKFQRIGRSPGDMTVSPDGRRLYVTHFDLYGLRIAVDGHHPIEQGYAPLAILDTETLDLVHPLIPVCAVNHGVRTSADGSKVFVACYGDDNIAIVDATTFDVTRVPLGPGPGVYPMTIRYQPNSVHVSPADGRVWVMCHASQDVRLFDPAAGAMVSSCAVSVGGLPMYGVFTDGGATLVVPVQGDGADLAFIDTASCSERAADRVRLAESDCVNPHMLVFGEQGASGPAYLVCEGDHSSPGSFVVLDRMHPGARVLASVPVGVFPDGAAFAYPDHGVNPP